MYAVATFASDANRETWLARRRQEAWFPAKWIVVGGPWVAWTSRADVAAAVAHRGRGRAIRLKLPQAVAHVTQVCDVSSSRCRLPSARPVPASPSGFVYSFTSRLADMGEMESHTGVHLVTSTDPGTAGITGIVESKSGPIAALRVSVRALDPRLPSTRLTTVTDRWGSFAFTNLPVRRGGSCYVIAAYAPRLISIRYGAVFTANETSQVTWGTDTSHITGADTARCSRAAQIR